MAGHIPDSLSVDWCTPDWVCECLKEIFLGAPDLDPCSNPYSRVDAAVEFTLEKGNDGLIDRWNGKNIYVNPPFGKGWWKPAVIGPTGLCIKREYMWPSERKLLVEKVKAGTLSKAELNKLLGEYLPVNIGHWIEKCALVGSSAKQNVIGLIPAYPGTAAWQKNVWPRARAVFFPKGRLHFRLVYLQPDGSTIEKTGPAPMDCALPLWSQDPLTLDRFRKVFSKRGHVQLVTP